ncbi:MAG: hypothetical protein OXC48_10545, partial [Endozoicomonadaceae bacterium]|nr:hypothetical protein [Endozoicomonadaceae bacterium]
TSFSIAPEEIEATPLETPTMETETKKSTTNIALLSAIGPALCVTTAVGCCCGCYLDKMKNCLCKIINKKNNSNAEDQDEDT